MLINEVLQTAKHIRHKAAVRLELNELIWLVVHTTECVHCRQGVTRSDKCNASSSIFLWFLTFSRSIPSHLWYFRHSHTIKGFIWTQLYIFFYLFHCGKLETKLQHPLDYSAHQHNWNNGFKVILGLFIRFFFCMLPIQHRFFSILRTGHIKFAKKCERHWKKRYINDQRNELSRYSHVRRSIRPRQGYNLGINCWNRTTIAYI